MNFRELRIAPTLTVSVGFMVLLAVRLVLYLHWNSSRKIMSELAGHLVLRNLEVASQGIEGHLDPVLRQTEYVAGLVEGGVYDLDARARLGDLLMGAVAATPQSGGMEAGWELYPVIVRRLKCSAGTLGLGGRRFLCTRILIDGLSS